MSHASHLSPNLEELGDNYESSPSRRAASASRPRRRASASASASSRLGTTHGPARTHIPSEIRPIRHRRNTAKKNDTAGICIADHQTKTDETETHGNASRTTMSSQIPPTSTGIQHVLHWSTLASSSVSLLFPPVEILPGRLLSFLSEPDELSHHRRHHYGYYYDPPEPPLPPPVPNTMVKLLLVGPQDVGKTSIVQRFVYRHDAAILDETVHGLLVRPHQSSPPPKQPQSWSVTYHKKDLAYWRRCDTLTSGATHAGQPSRQPPQSRVCATRVQLWDTTGCQSLLRTTTRRTHTRDTTTAPHPPRPSTQQQQQQQQRRTRQDEWQALLQSTDTVLLVLSLEHGAQQLVQDIVTWKDWLDHQCGNHNKERPVVLLVHKSDLLCRTATATTPSMPPLVWIQLGAQLETVCRTAGIHSWHLTTTASSGRSSRTSSRSTNTVSTTSRSNATSTCAAVHDASIDQAIMTVVRDCVESTCTSVMMTATTCTTRMDRTDGNTQTATRRRRTSVPRKAATAAVELQHVATIPEARAVPLSGHHPAVYQSPEAGQ